MSSSLDGSSIQSFVMPKITSESVPVDVRFEQGKFRWADPLDPEAEEDSATVDEFEERIRALNDMVDSLAEKYGRTSDKRVVYCGTQEFKKFFNQAMEAVHQARKQIHIGMPLSTIFEAERDRRPVSARTGFGGGREIVDNRSYKTAPSGLLIPD